MAEARFCPQCGAPTTLQANFCAACGAPLPERRTSVTQPPQSSSSAPPRALMPGLIVLTFYLIAGTSLWLFVLRTQPFPTVAPAGGDSQASKGGSTLSQNPSEIVLPEEAKKLLANLVEKANAAPQDLKAWKTLAEAQSRAARIDSSYRSAALTSYRHVLELAPNDLEALRGVGNVYYDFEEFDKAIEYYQKYLALQPDDASVRTDMGTMYLYSGNVDRAIAEYQAVVAKKPDFFQAYFNLGIAYQEKGEVEKSRELLARAKSLTTDKAIQEKIDQVLAQSSGEGRASEASPSSAPQATASPTVNVDASLSPFQQAIEKLFRSHEIMGPRIRRIEWSAPTTARVLFQNFPISAMPPEVRERFLGKLRSQITEAKNSQHLDGQVSIELIDEDTNHVMETLTTRSS